VTSVLNRLLSSCGPPVSWHEGSLPSGRALGTFLIRVAYRKPIEPDDQRGPARPPPTPPCNLLQTQLYLG
jgi:hypothetical protein